MKTKIEQFVIDRVREKRMELKMSQATLAFCLDVSKGFIGDVENPNKRAKYNINHINELAKILNCAPSSFLPSEPIEDQEIISVNKNEQNE